jgi:hypothetical protein
LVVLALRAVEAAWNWGRKDLGPFNQRNTIRLLWGGLALIAPK